MPDIKHAILISMTADPIYSLVATAHGFSRWWAADVTDASGVVELGFFNRTTVYRLRLTANRPPTRAEWICESGGEWNQTRLVFQIEPSTSGTLLRFVHGDWRAETDYFTACNTTWGELMFRLKAVAEGQPEQPLFSASGTRY